MRIAVLLPVRNGADFITESVRSVLEQTHADFSLYICDDGSTDATPALLRSFHDKRIQIIQLKQNIGQFAAFNLLLQNCTETLVHFWSHDDCMHPNCLKETLLFHERFPEAGMSYCGADTIDDKGNTLQKWAYDATPELLNRTTYARYTLAYGCLGGSISQVAMNRIVTGLDFLFNPRLKHSGDFDMWTRIAENSTIGFIRQPLAHIRTHRQQVTHRYQNNYFSVVEGLPIIKRLMPWTVVAENEQRNILQTLHYPLYVHRMLSLLIRGHFKWAWQSFMILLKQDNFTTMLYNWAKYTYNPGPIREMNKKKALQKIFMA